MIVKDRLWIISNYNQNPSSVIEQLAAPYLICNQGDAESVPKKYRQGQSFKQTMHTGHNISDYLEFIIENYENLPDSLGFAKGNIFPRHIKEEIFLQRQNLDGFVPLYSDDATFNSQQHRLWFFQMVAQQVAPGYYLEKTTNWYVKDRKPGKYYPKLQNIFEYFFKYQTPKYIPFVPGACMIVPASKIRCWPIECYQRLQEAVTYDFFPVEAFHLERCMLYFFNFPKR